MRKETGWVWMQRRRREVGKNWQESKTGIERWKVRRLQAGEMEYDLE